MAPGAGMPFAGGRRERSEGGAVASQADQYEGENNMKYLAVSTNTKDVSPFLAAEFQRVDELQQAGTIIGLWVKADFSGAVLLLECADEAEATSALKTLPIAINDATDFVVMEVIDLDSVRSGITTTP
jgi:hypothetical protein